MQLSKVRKRVCLGAIGLAILIPLGLANSDFSGRTSHRIITSSDVGSSTGVTSTTVVSANTTSSTDLPGPVSPGQSTSSDPEDYYSPIQAGPNMTAETARSKVDSPSVVSKPTATYVKDATWGQYLAFKQLSMPSVAGLSPSNSVLIALAVGTVDYTTVSGTYQYSWIMQVYDQATSSYLGFSVGTGDVPAWYTALPDAS